MAFLRIFSIVLSLAGLSGFYYMMVLRHDSPQRTLGKDFKMPDVRLHYTPALLYNTYEEAGETGRPLMRLYWLYDFGLIICLLGVMIAVSANIVSSQTWVYPLMVWLTVARTLVDILENSLFLYFLRHFPDYHTGVARFAGVVTTGKHLLLFAWLFLLFMMLFLKAFGIG
ncbi:MAG TPA: hypothetical protein PKU80_00660 [Candidatus Limiplasma sp.]|nr:hypothetical protein [Candidatus Limiplasma sp.]HRX07613.1 hypothetical protein [Candidatus Limiplasma sp.]